MEMLETVYSKVLIHVGLTYMIEIWTGTSSKEQNLMLLYLTSL